MADDASTGYAGITPAEGWDFAASSAWNEALAAFEVASTQATADILTAALQVALRSAALETGAIEGLYTTSRGITRTVAVQGAAWEAALDEIGADVRGHFEAQLEALELVLDIATASKPITEVWIRQLHEVICRGQATYRVHTPSGVQDRQLRLGEYKTDPNHVTLDDGSTHWYCPPSDVPGETGRLMDQLRGEAFLALPAPAQAAYAHHAFVCIHPFADGNGRVARALAGVYSYRAAGVPLVVFSDQQVRYWDSLARADKGDFGPFVTFIEDRAIDTLGMMADQIREILRPLSAQGASLQNLFTAHGGLSHAEVQAVGRRAADAVVEALAAALDQTQMGADINTSIEPMREKIQCDFGGPFHTLDSGGGFRMKVHCGQPVAAEAAVTAIVGLADSVAERFSFVVLDANRPGDQPLRLRVDDLHPEITTAAEMRIAAWASTRIGSALSEIEHNVREQLRARGQVFED